MKRIIAICFLIMLVLSVMTSCTKNENSETKTQWSFNYTIDKNTYTQGETIRITVEVTNTGDDYSYVGSPIDLFGPAKLYPNSDENTPLDALPFANTCDATERVFEAGQKAQHTFVFYTNEQSTTGAYTLKVPFGTVREIFKDILVVEIPET